MSAQFQENGQAIEWLHAPRDPQHPPGPALCDWLTYSGLLTVRLKQACGRGFSLQLLDQRDGTGLMLARASLRRVILWRGDLPCVYAESYLPHEALDAMPGLRSLGRDPLGETLQSQAGVTRGAFSFALLRDPDFPPPLAATTHEAVWARRSSFRVGEAELVVAEAFLPGILDCGPARGGE